jgi:ureidoacrylate peracid hydrolase
MTIEIRTRPAPLTIEPSATVVVVVDMQHDFASKGGMFDLAGIDVSPINAIVPAVRRVIDAGREAGLLVGYLRMGFSDDLRDAGHPTSPTWVKHVPLRAGDEVTAPDGSPSRILVRGTWNTSIIDELAPHDADLVIDKHRYSGFHGTQLDQTLRTRGIDTLIVVGATTSVCVESTVRDAMMRDFRCIVVEDAVAEPIGADLPRTNHDASLLAMELLFAWITDTDEVVAALGRSLR